MLGLVYSGFSDFIRNNKALPFFPDKLSMVGNAYGAEEV